jgi:hypothetical protein
MPLAGIEVLLDDREQVRVEPGQGRDQRLHRGDTVRGLDHCAELHRIGEAQLLFVDPLDDLGVDLFEVHVADPVGVPLDQLEVVSAAVGDVPRVQAQGDGRGVGVGQEALHPLLGVDMAVGVRVEDQRDAELLGEDPAELRHAGAQVGPLLRLQVDGLGDGAVEVGVPLREQHEVPGAQCGEEPRHPAALVNRLGQRVLAAVQAGEHGATGQPEAAAVELVGQPCRVGGQVAERTQLDPRVARLGGLVQELLPRHLLGVVREPHPPGVGRRTEPDPVD